MSTIKKLAIGLALLIAVWLLWYTISTGNVESAMFTGMFVYLGFFIYFVPVLVAANNNHPAAVSIFLLNLFLGWTVLGWVAALVWAAMPVKPAA